MTLDETIKEWPACSMEQRLRDAANVLYIDGVLPFGELEKAKQRIAKLKAKEQKSQ